MQQSVGEKAGKREAVEGEGFFMCRLPREIMGCSINCQLRSLWLFFHPQISAVNETMGMEKACRACKGDEMVVKVLV
jgi:hypothetical protein